ncbi:MAG TPA: cytochrome P450 [Leucothrix mucor]|nr:cytochrome P450 [Leucothrix mucor]
MSCPIHPKPLKNKASLLFTFFIKRNSWLNGLFERSYSMKTGRVKLPGLEIVVANELPLVKGIMVDDVEKYPKNRLLHELLEPLLGDSIFTTNGCQWRKQRDLLNPAFAHARVSKVFSLMRESTDDMLTRLDKIEAGSHFDMDAEMTFVTADIIFRTIMTTKLDAESAQKITSAFTRFQNQSLKISMLRMFKIPLIFSYREHQRKQAAVEIRGALEKVIRPRYDAVTSGDETEGVDILSSLLLTKDPDTEERFSFKEIVDQVSMLFLAGHETSASALSWAFYLISEYPEIQAEAYEEIDSVVGERAIEAKDIKKLTLVTAIFRETLRLYPPVGFMMREAAEEVTLRDKIVKAGKAVVISPWLIHRNKDNWDRPHDFDPQRFLKEHNPPLKSKYLPFGMGQRVCIGASFAMQEAVLIIATILQQYRIEAIAGFEPQPVGRLTIRSENGINVQLFKR